MKQNFYSLIGLICLAVCVSPADGAVVLTTFGTSGGNAFLVDGTTDFGYTQGTDSITISGTDSGNDLLAGTFAPVSILGQSSILRLTGSTTAAPVSGFNITIFDESFKTAIYNGGAWTGLNSGGTNLTFGSAESGFDFSKVIGMQLDTGGVGGNPIGATLNGLSTIPEPSRIMLLGLGIVGLGLRRRRLAEV
jgi:hypothetical protein